MSVYAYIRHKKVKGYLPAGYCWAVGEIAISQLCLEAPLSKRGNLYMHCPLYKPDNKKYQRLPHFQFYIYFKAFIFNFCMYELSTIFTLHTVYSA